MAPTYKPPSAIINHPGVQSCTDGRVDSDYLHDVWLREGWCWSAGRNAGGRGLFVNTVSEFKGAGPVKLQTAIRVAAHQASRCGSETSR